eukprot:4417026-Lingulodinium_polyedra.AAC.1
MATDLTQPACWRNDDDDACDALRIVGKRPLSCNNSQDTHPPRHCASQHLRNTNISISLNTQCAKTT